MTWNWISKLEDLRKEGRPFVSITVTQCTGSTPREPGAKMLVLGDGSFLGTIGGGHLEQLAIEDALKLLDAPLSKTVRYPLGAKTGQCCGGTVDLFFEVLNNGPKLYLFGAGHVGQAICRTLSGTPFTVHLIDEREEWVNSREIPQDVVRHKGEWEDFVDQAQWDAERTYAAIMTFRHDMDFMILEEILKKQRPFRYLGLIGSLGKRARFEQRLLARSFDPQRLTCFQCPIGISIGGKAPQEVAISFAADLLRIHYEREKR
jgi:xanthine dehydrogenase accessory factor